MARTSRRFEDKQTTSNSKVLYRAGIYTRLSNERTESWRDKSSSIETQTLACREYALKENIKVIDVFTDYEYSGTNFDRPEFQNMMQAVKERRINCIIIKDLSRLGREYLEMGRLIDKVFPFLGVRFISVNDKLDTVKEMDSKKSFEVTIKNIINDMYAKDISVKIKTSKRNRAEKGYFIGSTPPYGYRVVKEEGGQRLEVDENVRFIVEEMFDLTLEGKSQLEVTKHLNEVGYTTPSVYYKTKRIYREDEDPEWHVGSVGKLLNNQAYAGDMVQGIKSQYLAEGKKQKLADKSDYIIVEDTHEAIIPREVFFRIQNERKQRKANSVFSAKPHDFKRDPENRFDGLVFYHETGEKLYRRTRIVRRGASKILQYLYRIERFDGSIEKKETLFIMEADLDKRIASDIKRAVKALTSKRSFTKRIKEKYAKALEEAEVKLADFDKAIIKEENSLQKSYEQYSLGKIDRDTYLLERDTAYGRITTAEREKLVREDLISKLKKERKNALAWIRDIFSAKDMDKLPAELIQSLVEKVLVYKTHEFEVIYQFDMEGLREDTNE